ncbi:MAG: 23S rRNA (guanosine(2251)-2'-O)-methyltransferase RlmB [Acidimicrobiales bacterium]
MYRGGADGAGDGGRSGWRDLERGRVSPAKGGRSARGGAGGRSARGGAGGRGIRTSNPSSPPRSGTSRSGGARRSGTGGDRDQPPRRGTDAQGIGGEQVEGRQAVRELLSANRRQVNSLLMAEGMDQAAILDEIEMLASKRRIKVSYVSRRRIDLVARTEGAQGVVALARPVAETSLEVMCEPSSKGGKPFLLVLDGVTDPHNLGALLRSAECAGVTGVILPRHRSAHLSPTVAKVAAGAIEYLPMASVGGVPTALQRISALGVWTVGLAGDAPRSLYELPLENEAVALVLGSEGTGLAALTRKRCDALASIPQHGTLSSLNVATAGAIACFDIARRRSH